LAVQEMLQRYRGQQGDVSGGVFHVCCLDSMTSARRG
jgi:hypothetical protein